MTEDTALAIVPPRTEAITITKARREIEVARERVANRLNALQREFAEATHWKTVVRKHPVAVTVTVVVVGYVLARLFLPRRR